MVATQEREYLTLPHADKVLIRPAPGGMKDICYRQELLGCSSMRPIVHQVLDREKTLLAELRCTLYQLGCVPRHIKQLRVDSMTLQPGRRLSKAVLAYQALHPSGRPAGLVVLHPFQPAHHPLLLLLITTEAHDDIDTNVCNCV